jgi:hypothetical protein
MRLRKPFLAALAAGAAATPVGIALAAETLPARTSSTPPTLRVPLGGQPTAAAAMRDHARSGPEREHAHLALRYAALSGRHETRAGAARRAAALSPAALRRANRSLRASVRELDVPIPPVMWKIAQCESHGDPRAIGGGGTFRGALQFMQSTWKSVGGKGDPAAAPMREQLRRGAILMARSGSSPWPVCGA